MSRKNAVFLGAVILIFLFLPGYSKYQQLKEKNRQLLSDIERITKENKELAKEITKLEKDPFYIEKKARDKMGVSKEGEIKYKVIYEKQDSR